MNLLSIKDLTKIGREAPLFTDVTLGLDEGQKAALIGKNGAGKSTLLNCVAGVLAPDKGSVVFNKEAGFSYLAQTPAFDGEDTIRGHIFKSDSPKLKIINEYQSLCVNLGNLSQAQAERYDALEKKMNDGDLWNYEAQISSILSTLGIHDLDRKMKTLSGGMAKKVALAQVLVEDTKILLLDEPTNHLDIKTISWLEDYLRSTSRAVFMVTHDRYFLDSVCSDIYELERGRLTLYHGNYSEYLEKKEKEIEIAKNTDRRIESVLRFERDWLLRGPCARGTKAKARIQRDQQLIAHEKFQEDKGFSFETKETRLGGKILELHRLSKNFPKGFAVAGGNASQDPNAAATSPVLKDFSYTFSKGQKIGIYGNNGSGKTTLLNMIAGRLPPDGGNIVLGVNTHIAYYEQNPTFKDLTMTSLEYIEEAAEWIELNDGRKLSAALFLNEFGFEGRIQHSPVSSLSGGERKRLYLVRLLISNPNFIILDEPTNDFDIWTMNILEDFLTQFKGCLLVVSHDRYFMDKVCDTLFILEDDGSVAGFVGKCSEYIELLKEKEREAARDSKQAQKSGGGQNGGQAKNGGSSNSSQGQEAPQAAPADKPKKLSFKEQKEFAALEADIETLEARKTELEAALSSGESDFAKIRAWNDEYQSLSAVLDSKYARWEELAARV
ncbi:MAG: ABC-F family ATP-binding cassette domain-containing protein [Treponema sp.]|nr:ABC-F family ATP-binding cassette domain-containing protein [Treponema sp.]MEE3435702.1 ABC-F family ATP-binding cassette domain-containing protein [Treponema sp.]